MKLKALALAGVAALGLFASNAQAQSFAQCIGTETVTIDGSIVDAAIATPELSTLVDAVIAAGLADALATTPGLTVFAPTNEAFGAIPADILGGILADTDVLTAILAYHVIVGTEDPRKYIQPRRVETLNGQSVFLSRFDGAARVNEATASCTRVRTNNGDVFIVDAVLTPQF